MSEQPETLSEFIVWDVDYSRYIADIDACDGDVEYTDNICRARIFSGEMWRDHWSGERYRVMSPPM